MKYKNTISLLVLCLAITAAAATGMGIFSHNGSGPYPYTSIRGKTVWIYGKGIYRHMSAEVAPQGIAQDYVTLCLGIPLLLISLYMARRGSLSGRLLLTGTLGYFLVTYLFYLVMGMYNFFFLGYVFLLGASFFAFILSLFSFNVNTLPISFSKKLPVKFTGGFLIFLACCITLLWLSIVVPPLLDGTIIPLQTEHYTTLIVQGLDLAILLPSAVVSGVLFLRKKPTGYLLTPVYYVFLSLLMTALTAKVIAMAILGYGVIPVIFIIPAFTIITIICTLLILKSVNNNNSFSKE
jgi:hypothetical protein